MAMLAVAEAQARVLTGAGILGPETVPLAEAAGRTTAVSLTALRTQPPFDASAMDGYAVRAVDTGPGAVLQMIGTAAAGSSFAGNVSIGQTVRIFTGAPVPEGADAVLMQEYAEPVAEGRIRVTEPVTAGRHIRRAGVDFTVGQTLIAAGSRLDWRALSLAAAMNHATLAVARRPRVAILATGDELMPPGSAPGPDQIIASNSYGIAALVTAAGGLPHDLGIAPDRHAEIFERVRAAIALPADILVTLGGASVGDLDLVRPVLGSAGMDLDFWKIAMRPGKPLMFGRLGDMRVLGLPGNPVSSMVAAKLFLEPLIRALQGDPDPLPAVMTARCGANLKANDIRQDYLRGTLSVTDGDITITPVDNQDSSLLSRLVRADALIIRPPEAPAVQRGAPVPYIRF